MSDAPLPPAEVSRRRLLSIAGRGALLIGAAGAMSAAHAADAPSPGADGVPLGGQPLNPVKLPAMKLPDILATTEKKRSGPPEPLRPADRIGYAVVGLGHLALEEILPAMAQAKRSKVVALVSGSKDKATTVAQQYGIEARNIYDYDNYEKLADNPEVQAIYIVLPNGLHAEYTIRGAKAGKHILCEKPMANGPGEAQLMIDVCAEQKRKLMIAYRCQYEPYNREVIRLARSGELGTIKFISAGNGQNQGDPAHWRLKKALAGGGSLADVGIYCLNAARYITGEEPIEITGRVQSSPGDRRFSEVEESVAFQLLFPSGVLASLTCGYGHHEHRRLDVIGAEGWAELQSAFTYRGLRLTTGRAKGKSEEVCEHRLDEQNHFALEMDHFSRCIQEGKDPHTGGEEGLQDLRIIEAIYRSAADGGRPVTFQTRKGLDLTRGPAPL